MNEKTDKKITLTFPLSFAIEESAMQNVRSCDSAPASLIILPSPLTIPNVLCHQCLKCVI